MAALILVTFIFAPGASAEPVLIECPGSNAHVWDRDQCPRLGGPFQPGSGGSGGGGLIGSILHTIGGLLGL